MADLYTPIVLTFPDRGACAIDYIDYFDEGLYGPDKAFFVARFKKENDILKSVATQMNTCLSLQNTDGSMIHVNRIDIPDKWVEPLCAKDDPYPRRAQYKIRFLLRIKFYGEFAYIDLGAPWEKDDDFMSPIDITANDLKVVNRCWISQRDAEYFLELLKENGLNYDGTTKYDPETGSPVALTAEEIAAKEAAANATYITDGEIIISDDEGSLTI